MLCKIYPIKKVQNKNIKNEKYANNENILYQFVYSFELVP